MAVGGKRGSCPGGAESPAACRAGRETATAADDLLLRVAGGDTEAFASLHDQFAGAVYGLARRIAGDRPRAEQLAAEVMLEVWRSASRFSPAEGSGLSWIMAIALRRATSHATSRAAPDGGDPAGRGPTPTHAVAQRDVGSLLADRGLACLPGPQRQALLLACCGYTVREAADLVGVPSGTVAERLRDGLLGLDRQPH